MTDERMMGGKFIGVDGATEQDMIDGLDPGIVCTVKWLRANGFNTTDSGDGRTKFTQGYTEDDGVCPYAHVAITIAPTFLVSGADRLSWLLLEEHGITVEPLGPEEDGIGPPRIDATYCPASRTAMLILVNVEDDMLTPLDPARSP